MNTNVDYKHPAYNEFLPEWDMIGDCVDGERVVKSKKEKYLPHPADKKDIDDKDNERYKRYLSRASFFNATGRTLSGLLGIAFSKPVKISVSGGVEYLEADIDGQGQPLTQMIRDALSQNLQRGRAGLLSDFSGSGIQSEANKGRPYVRLFTAKEIINWRVTNGKTSLVVLKYQEPVDTDDFELQMQNNWIELRLVNNVACSRRWYEDGDIKVTEWVVLKDAHGIPLRELPWSWIGSMNNDHTPDAPPLADIAYVNIKHYQAEADIAESAHTVGQPMVALTGLTDNWIKDHMSDGFTVGSRKGVLLPEGGDMKFAQPEDRNIQITLAERREKQMAMLGAKLVERGTSARTATQAQDEAQTDNSVLSLCSGNVETGI
ncbi:phage protein [Proteus vulgaris]|nr:phage protein [Proteus vulgaris]